MKKYSNYYKIMMVIAIISGVLACIVPNSTGAVILSVCSFILWYAGVMAPDNEKYKQHYYTEEELRLGIMNTCDNMEKTKDWNESCWKAFNSVAKVKKDWIMK